MTLKTLKNMGVKCLYVGLTYLIGDIQTQLARKQYKCFHGTCPLGSRHRPRALHLTGIKHLFDFSKWCFISSSSSFFCGFPQGILINILLCRQIMPHHDFRQPWRQLSNHWEHGDYSIQLAEVEQTVPVPCSNQRPLIWSRFVWNSSALF